MLNVAIVDSEVTAPTQPRNGLEAWFRAMGQTDFARMDEDKPLVRVVNRVIESEYQITFQGWKALHEDKLMRLAQMN